MGKTPYVCPEKVVGVDSFFVIVSLVLFFFVCVGGFASVQPECGVSGVGPSFGIGGGVTGRKPMGSDCDHEGSLATWLWSSIDGQISSS